VENRFAMGLQPLSDGAGAGMEIFGNAAFGIGADIEEQIAALGGAVAECVEEWVGTAPALAPCPAPEAPVTNLAGFPKTGLFGGRMVLRRAEIAEGTRTAGALAAIDLLPIGAAAASQSVVD
jgi:hypothetical protein